MGGEAKVKAVGLADYLYAQTAGFKDMVAKTLNLIQVAADKGRLGVSFSGGKDSTVVLDLVRRVIPDAPAAFFDSGCEFAQTYEIVKHYGVEVFQATPSLLEMCRHGGYWGYPHPVAPDATFNFTGVLVYEPARRFAAENNLQVIALGLRAEESRGRKANAQYRGMLYFAEYDGLWHCCPLARWSVDDVWAYIADRQLAYNQAYDCMQAMGIPREDQRVCIPLGSSAAAQGRFVKLKQIDPELYNRLAAEFPKIRIYS